MGGAGASPGLRPGCGDEDLKAESAISPCQHPERAPASLLTLRLLKSCPAAEMWTLGSGLAIVWGQELAWLR